MTKEITSKKSIFLSTVKSYPIFLTLSKEFPSFNDFHSTNQSLKAKEDPKKGVKQTLISVKKILTKIKFCS